MLDKDQHHISVQHLQPTALVVLLLLLYSSLLLLPLLGLNMTILDTQRNTAQKKTQKKLKRI